MKTPIEHLQDKVKELEKNINKVFLAYADKSTSASKKRNESLCLLTKTIDNCSEILDSNKEFLKVYDDKCNNLAHVVCSSIIYELYIERNKLIGQLNHYKCLEDLNVKNSDGLYPLDCAINSAKNLGGVDYDTHTTMFITTYYIAHFLQKGLNLYNPAQDYYDGKSFFEYCISNTLTNLLVHTNAEVYLQPITVKRDSTPLNTTPFKHIKDNLSEDIGGGFVLASLLLNIVKSEDIVNPEFYKKDENDKYILDYVIDYYYVDHPNNGTDWVTDVVNGLTKKSRLLQYNPDRKNKGGVPVGESIVYDGLWTWVDNTDSNVLSQEITPKGKQMITAGEYLKNSDDYTYYKYS